MSKTHSQKKEEILSFLKEAFCIDGEATLTTVIDMGAETLAQGQELDSMWVRLEDSKRGTFYLCLMKPQDGTDVRTQP